MIYFLNQSLNIDCYCIHSNFNKYAHILVFHVCNKLAIHQKHVFSLIHEIIHERDIIISLLLSFKIGFSRYNDIAANSQK